MFTERIFFQRTNYSILNIIVQTVSINPLYFRNEIFNHKLSEAKHQIIDGYCFACSRTLLLYSAGSCKFGTKIQFLQNCFLSRTYNQITQNIQAYKRREDLNKELIPISLCWIGRVRLIEQILDPYQDLFHCNGWSPSLGREQNVIQIHYHLLTIPSLNESFEIDIAQR